MNGLFEKSDSLNTPIECFIFNAEREAFPVKPHWHYFAEFIKACPLFDQKCPQK